MSQSERPFSWRSIALPALLPSLIFSIGEGAIIPVIPLVASNLGASLAVAGIVTALLTIGELVGNIPSGWVIARIGERPAMIGASALAAIGVVICLIAPNAVALGFGVLIVGLAAAVFALARHAFLTSFVPLAYRARALSTLGGTHRAGFFVGPFITAGVIQLTGQVMLAFWVMILACIIVTVVLVALPDPAKSFGAVRTVRMNGRVLREGEALVEREASGLFRTIYERRDVLARMGLGAALIGALRASRQVIMPLWAVSIGLGAADTALIIGVAGAIDFALFYPSGYIMDRLGRLWSALPSMLGLGIGHLMLAFTHDLDTNVGWFIAAALVLAFGNGLGSGILMTIGADLADPVDPAPFLGAFRFTGSLGGATAPMLLAGITAAASIAIGAGVIGVLGIVGAGVLYRYIPRYSQR